MKYRTAVLESSKWPYGVAAAEPQGYILLTELTDEINHVDYEPEELPVELPLDALVSAQIGLVNHTDSPYSCDWLVEFIDPEGNSQGRNEGAETIDAHYAQMRRTLDIALDKRGAWQLHAVMAAAGTPLDEHTWDALVVPGANGGVPKEIPWMWIGIGAGGIIALATGIVLSRRRKR